MKRFNTTGTCRPDEHYMVDITERLEIIRKMISKGEYFCINRGRQYGKSTTISNLKTYLENAGYCVFSISFEKVDDACFSTLSTTASIFLRLLSSCIKTNEVKNLDSKCAEPLLLFQENHADACAILDISELLIQLCADNPYPIVLLIDDVEQASENDGFINFLGFLRSMYLQRNSLSTFQSIIFASIKDIKNLKLKTSLEELMQTSPYGTITMPFSVDMALSVEGIKGMLDEYEADYHKGMNTADVASWIREYTNGYPYLVSRLCQLMDEHNDWSYEGFLSAVKFIINNKEDFFEDIKRNINNDSDLCYLLQAVVTGKYICYTPYARGMEAALTNSYIKEMVTPVEISTKMHMDYIVSNCFNS